MLLVMFFFLIFLFTYIILLSMSSGILLVLFYLCILNVLYKTLEYGDLFIVLSQLVYHNLQFLL